MISSVILAEILEVSGCSTIRLVHVAVLALAIPPLHNQQSFLPKTSQRSPWRSDNDGLSSWPDMARQSFRIAARRSFGWMGFDSSSKS